MKKTIAIDFDGVIHAYSKKWHDGSIYDLPIPGTAIALKVIQNMGYEVAIFSTRCYDRVVNGVKQLNQVEQMKFWLELHKIPYDRIHTADGKPLCVLFIDDNAYRFQGKWSTAVMDISQILEPAK